MRLYKLVIQYGDPEDFIPYLFIMRRNYGRAGWRVKAINMATNYEHKSIELIPKMQNPYDVIMMWLDIMEDLEDATIRTFEEVKL